MSRRVTILSTLALAGAGVASVALASGGAPAVPPQDPPANTIIASGAAQRPVVKPSHRSNASVQRAVDRARARAIPAAVSAARAEAAVLAGSVGLRVGQVIGIRRDTQPLGYYGQEEGRFGPGTWCGRLYVGTRRVRRANGTTRRVPRFRNGCAVPKNATVRVTLTFAVAAP